MSQQLLTYGIDKKTGELRYIKDVPSGLKCNCKCPKCGGDLEAHKGEKKTYHFHHHSDAHCQGAFESQIHLLSKAIIEEKKMLMLPVYTGRYSFCPQRRQTFTDVVKECAQDDLQPDCLCKYQDKQGNEQTLWVEIQYSHAVDEAKTRKIRERKIACVEVDVSGVFKDMEVIDKDTLIDFLLNRPDSRKWINNPQGDEQVLAEADEIRKQKSIVSFINDFSTIEALDDRFKMLIYCLFSTDFRLSQTDYNQLYEFVKKHQSDYESLHSILQWRYMSAIQMLLCHLTVTGRYNTKGISKENFLYAVCFDRDGLLQKRSTWTFDVVRSGALSYRPQRTIIRQRESTFYIDNNGVRRRRYPRL